MESGSVGGNMRILKPGDLMGDRAYVYYCVNCGYVELYKERSSREPQRWRVPSPELEQAAPSEKPQKPKESREEEPKGKAEKKLIR